MSRLPLVYDPDPILNKKCEHVEEISADIKQLSLDMAETMYKENGVGLAAPQIGKSIRMFVVSHKDGVKTFINPEIYWKSLFKNVDEEGCLSIPGVFGPVKRHNAIKIRYTDENGEKQDLKAEGFLARIIQHEFDHIEGILFTEKVVGGPKKLRKETE